MSDTEVSVEPLVSDDEVMVLNTARDVLVRLGDRCLRASWEAEDAYSLGRLAECAETGADGIFATLNTMTSYGLRPLTEDQVHNRKGDTPDV